MMTDQRLIAALCRERVPGLFATIATSRCVLPVASPAFVPRLEAAVPSMTDGTLQG